MADRDRPGIGDERPPGARDERRPGTRDERPPGTRDERPPGIDDERPPGTRDEASIGLRLHEVATRFGAYRWVERRLFELTGAWAAAPGLPDEAQVFCFEVSAQHAWHAELWEARLPALAGVDRERLTRPLGPTVEPLLERLSPEAFDGTDEAAGRRFLVGLARVVLPLLVVSYRGLGRRLVPVADGPAIRALTLVLRDEEEELAVLESMVSRLLAAPDVAQETAEWIRELSEPVVQGGLQEGEHDGLLPWTQGIAAW